MNEKGKLISSEKPSVCLGSVLHLKINPYIDASRAIAAYAYILGLITEVRRIIYAPTASHLYSPVFQLGRTGLWLANRWPGKHLLDSKFKKHPNHNEVISPEGVKLPYWDPLRYHTLDCIINNVVDKRYDIMLSELVRKHSVYYKCYNCPIQEKCMRFNQRFHEKALSKLRK